MADDIVLNASGLVMEFKGFRAVDGANLDIARGSIHALIGPNGAGKSTCFNLLTKVLTPTSGSIRFEGRDITGLSPANVSRLGIVRSFQISAVFGSMTSLENVRIALQRRRHGDSWDFWRSDRALASLHDEAMELLSSVGLADYAGHVADDLPYGRKRALEIATTLALEPRVLLLDEPMAGMTQEDVARISALIRKVAVGRTVVMVEHNLSVVADLCDRITVLARGKVLAEGVYSDISRDPRVIEAYIGVPHA
ncbi:ABC transporter ATP-binding protein [Mesorhizobium sp. KR1-2]|uniref:ABC transporter ATP-binding protein n=1 Tax=Mesorhizobium sp. KR1-2 TaxID=3156609 RepID=UPI0032B510E4